MPIESKHPLYKVNIERWQMCRVAYEGEDAVKAAGTTYLPKVDPQQTGPEYAAYLKRALYYEAVGRTVDGFVGAISRKPHGIEVPETLKPLIEDATADQTELSEFIKRLASETLLLGRGGVLVDFDADQNRAYLKFYTTECITNWNAAGVVLHETVYENDLKDQYNQVSVEQLRQLHMQDGRYTVTVWRKAENSAVGQAWVVHSETVPTRRGAPLTAIPFFWLSAMGRSNRIEKPPLLGLVNVAMSHYRTSADLEHGRHFTGMPTLWVSGSTSEEPIRIGAAAAIVLSDPSARAGYAEFTGQGLGSLENALQSKEHMMAVLGAAVFGGAKKGIEAAETARIRTAGENSLLMGVVSAVEQTIVAALQCAAEWMGAPGAVTVKLNRDFIDQPLDPQTLVGLVGAYQAGMITLESFLYSLQQAEMLPPETDIDEEVKTLQAAAVKKAAQAADAALKAAKVAAEAHQPGQPVAD